MKLSAIVCALAATSAAAFVPAAKTPATSSLEAVDRRSAFGQIAAAGAAVVAAPSIASADGAVSSASITKAKVVYGGRIADLKAAVESGDFAAVADEKNAFILYNSGAYPAAKSKAAKAAAIEDTNAIFAAIRAQDKSALKSAYDKYIADNEITGVPAVDPATGQGYSSDYGYTRLTKAGAIYVR
mmetsp:Transcript_2061/g.2929  ORF Transcript_2061/g.2929 Transcript_2061/m.2929 type:complete len:185 (+) Transcript_2061:92-646(+)|eukprot:CAMPEP_0178910766 /NCGR_PEP_ID=MMETSP0786-20121207/9283_1 /TAXON_ID=186022 /ORGANISM="Thalassionema frauenfeldii, Strain CCMP 1798" /LENGTH=184 /DNA_ID=CAMNT_0020583061 /DNA_START=38 /DNA_END=592 /DNA_ORIENTATION=+